MGRRSRFVAALVLFGALYAIWNLSSKLSPSRSAIDDIPGSWVNPGTGNTEFHVPDVEDPIASIPSEDQLFTKDPTELFRRTVRTMLGPWLPMPVITPQDEDEYLDMAYRGSLPLFPKQSIGGQVLTDNVLNAMELELRNGAVRVRWTGAQLLVRQIVHYDVSYRRLRAAWVLDLIKEMSQEGMFGFTSANNATTFDAVIYVGDPAKVRLDTMGKFAGFPLIGLLGSVGFGDIILPDPVAFGSNGQYVWPDPTKLVPWDKREDRVIFRGKAGCFDFGADNWFSCVRVRAGQLSNVQNEYMDLGITAWNRLKAMPPYTHYNISRGLALPPSEEDLSASSNVNIAKTLSFVEQSRFKFVLDVDGGAGSSRRFGILQSGSVPFFQKSPHRRWFEPWLIPWVNYIPVSSSIDDLAIKVAWARRHPGHVRRILDWNTNFAKAYLSWNATKEYTRVVLSTYGKLLPSPATAANVSRNYCDIRPDVRTGPIGCSTGWNVLFDVSAPPP